MRRFKSMVQAQRFVGVHAAVTNLFNLGRHLVAAGDCGCAELTWQYPFRAVHYSRFRRASSAASSCSRIRLCSGSADFQATGQRGLGSGAALLISGTAWNPAKPPPSTQSDGLSADVPPLLSSGAV
jgi:hypothetical protein